MTHEASVKAWETRRKNEKNERKKKNVKSLKEQQKSRYEHLVNDRMVRHNAAIKAWETRRKNEKNHRLLVENASGYDGRKEQQKSRYEHVRQPRKVTWKLWKVDNFGKRILVKEVVECIRGKWKEVGCTIIDDKTII